MIQSIFATILLACSGIVSGANQPSRFTRAESTPSSGQQNQKPSLNERILEAGANHRRRLHDSFDTKAQMDKAFPKSGAKDPNNRAKNKA
ncbi:hypothetical protein DSO57_1007480 [Entomophthora muscae]|uniref:Uncharacterized protein n=1 Tax=Entomophthora muscae TaxID=34485 RepID=A0ACC2TIF0_9FUNG|nr:hypothetical protein DSO57_1007480 [Entomophthora muscae]